MIYNGKHQGQSRRNLELNFHEIWLRCSRSDNQQVLPHRVIGYVYKTNDEYDRTRHQST